MRVVFVPAALAVMMSLWSMPALAGVVARISLSQQIMHVAIDDRTVCSQAVSTARRGYRTPVGTFRPTRLHKMWYSRKCEMSPMPHSIFFYGGYAIHGTYATKSLGRPASHGCVWLHPSNATKLYSIVRRHGSPNTRIVITR